MHMRAACVKANGPHVLNNGPHVCYCTVGRIIGPHVLGKLHSEVCHIRDYVAFGIMSFRIMSHLGICHSGLCHIRLRDYVAFGIQSIGIYRSC